MIFNKKILSKDFIVNKFLPYFSVSFFIVSKFFFNFLLWRGRILPPEPGDVFDYFQYLQSIRNGHLALTSIYTAYTFILGNISRFLDISVEKIFYCSFFVGFILLALALWKFFRKMHFSSLETSACFFVLAFYIGHGAFHGFYWVVPSFFAFLTFLYLFGSVASRDRLRWWPTIVAAIFLPLFHGTGIFSLAVFVFYLIFYHLFLLAPKFSFRRFLEVIDWVLIKRTIIVVLVSLFSFFAIAIILPIVNHSSLDPNDKTIAYGNIINQIKSSNSKIVTEAVQNSKEQLLQYKVQIDLSKIIDRYNVFRQNYLNKIIPHPIFILAWVGIIGVLVYYKKFQLLSFFLATFFFSLLSSLLHYKGFRSLLYLWPVTYILVIYSFFYIFKLLKDWTINVRLFHRLNVFKFIRKVSLIIFFVLIAIFCIFNVVYSFWYIGLKNDYMNIQYNPKMFDAIFQNYSPRNTEIYVDWQIAVPIFLYRSDGLNYKVFNPLWKSYKDDLVGSPPPRIVFILEDDKNIYKNSSSATGNLCKEILKKILFLPITTNVNDVSRGQLSMEEKLKSLSLNDIGKQRIIYRDDNFYIFEVVR